MSEIEMLAEAGDAPDGAPASGVDLRRRLVDCVLKRGGEEIPAALDRFLAEDDWKSCLAEWLPDIKAGQAGGFDTVRATLARDIAAIDILLGDQIDEILHAPAFKAIEAAWRGVELLVQTAGDEDKVRVRLFNATWHELSRDFERSIEFDQSTLFAKVYNEEYGMPGGIPYGLLVFDYAVRHRSAPNSSADDVSTLSGIAQVAAASFSPSVVGAAPELFGLTTFADLSYAQRLDSGFKLGEYHRWRKLREREDSRFLGVALPRVLMRDRYRDSDARLDGFRYAEGGSGVESWLWGNASFAYGVVAIRAFRKWGWFADICGTRGGIVNDLPAPDFSTREGIGYRRPLEVELTDKKQKVLEDLGFISMSPCSFTREMVMLGAQSLHLHTGEGGVVEQTNDGISSMLHYVMCVSRFAHYVKVMARDRVGAYATPYDLERYLDEWLRTYTIGNSDAGLETKARYPLSGARVEVRDVPGRPGMMSCTVHMSPHFQFDQVVSGFRMRTEVHGTRSR